jgi:hypothetical protein
MSEQVTSGGGNTTSFVIRWVQEIQVNALVHASDNFSILVGATLALLAAAVAAAIALGAGALHPVVVYIILGACGFGALITGGLSRREYVNVRSIRAEIKAAITEYHVPFTLTTGTSAVPDVTIGAAGITQPPTPPIIPRPASPEPASPESDDQRDVASGD